MNIQFDIWDHAWMIYWSFAIIGFFGIEMAAVATGNHTFSKFMWEIGQVWVWFPYVFTGLVLFLILHFWWGHSLLGN